MSDAPEQAAPPVNQPQTVIHPTPATDPQPAAQSEPMNLTQPPAAQAPAPPVAPPAAPAAPSEEDDILIDLDELKPSGKKVRVDGKIITLGQPTTEQLLDLIKLGKKLEGQTRENYDIDDLGEALKKVAEIVRTLAPELAEYQFNIVQALALINTLQGMAMPDKLKQLHKRGVTPAELPKDEAS